MLPKPNQTITPMRGTKKVFFFRRNHDGMIIPYDKERDAHKLMLRNDFIYQFKYLGWTDDVVIDKSGLPALKEVAEIGKEIATQVDEEMKEKTLTSDQKKEYKYTRTAELTREIGERTKEVLERKAKEVEESENKEPPRNMSLYGLDGNVMSDGMANNINIKVRRNG